MSYTKEITVRCDNNACSEWDQVPARNITFAKKQVVSCGWKVKGRVVLCPYCAKKYGILNGEIVVIER